MHAREPPAKVTLNTSTTHEIVTKGSASSQIWIHAWHMSVRHRRRKRWKPSLRFPLIWIRAPDGRITIGVYDWGVYVGAKGRRFLSFRDRQQAWRDEAQRPERSRTRWWALSPGRRQMCHTHTRVSTVTGGCLMTMVSIIRLMVWWKNWQTECFPAECIQVSSLSYVMSPSELANLTSSRRRSCASGWVANRWSVRANAFAVVPMPADMNVLMITLM